MFLNTEIYENYSAVLQKQDGYYFLKQFLLTRIMINSVILMIEKVYESKKSAGLRYMEIDTLFLFLLDFYRNKVILGNCPLLMIMKISDNVILLFMRRTQ